MEDKKIDVLVIGAGLTGLTLAFYLKKAGKKVLILEKNNTVGGVINTLTEDGFTFETGPNTGVVGSPELVALFDDLQGKVTPEIANADAKNRWIWKSGRWEALPSGFIKAVTTPLFTLKDKFRIFGEPFRKPGTNPDETVAELVRRRLGVSFLHYAVDPFISGVYAGNPENLVTRYALPKLYNLEQNYGSFVKGSIKKRKEPKTDLEKRVSREVFSVKGGLKQLILGLYNEIGAEQVKTDAQNIQVIKGGNAYQANWENAMHESQSVITEKVITTIDGEAMKNMFPFINQDDLSAIAELTYAKVVQAIVGFKDWRGIKINAFGGLVPSKESRQCLGILFPSAIFKERAPEKGALLSVFMGGMRHPELIERNDDEIRQLVLDEIRETMQCSEQPNLLKIFRYQKAIPQYEITSGKRFDAIEKIQAEHPGIILAGNIRNGIGMSDRVKQGRQIADQLINK